MAADTTAVGMVVAGGMAVVRRATGTGERPAEAGMAAGLAAVAGTAVGRVAGGTTEFPVTEDRIK